MDNKIVLLVGITAGIAAAVYLLYQELRKQRVHIREQNMQIKALLQQAKRVEGLIYTYNIDQIEGVRGNNSRNDRRSSARSRSRIMSSHIFPMDESMRDMIYVWNEDNKELAEDDEKEEDILHHEHGLEIQQDQPGESDTETSNSHSSSDTETSSSEEEELSHKQQQPSQPQSHTVRFRPQNPVNLIPQSHLFRSPQIMNVPQQRFPRVPRMLSSHTSQPIAYPQRHTPQHNLPQHNLPQHNLPQQSLMRTYMPQLQRNRFVPPQLHQQHSIPRETSHTHLPSQSQQNSFNQSFVSPDGSAIGMISVTTSSEISVPEMDPAITSQDHKIESIKSFDVSSEPSEDQIEDVPQEPEKDTSSEEDNIESDRNNESNVSDAESQPTQSTPSIMNTVLGGVGETFQSVIDLDDKNTQKIEEKDFISTKKRFYKDTPKNRQLDRVGKPY